MAKTDGVKPLTADEAKWLESLKQKIEYVAPDSIELSPNKERVNDSTVPALANSIRTLGFRSPIYVDAAGIVRIGHTRLKAARALGLKKVPIVRLEADLPAEKIRLLQLADNKIAEMSEWNLPELQKSMDELQDSLEDLIPDFDFADFGFTDANGGADGVKDGETEADDVPEQTGEVVSKAGEVYALGDHLLVCGDSTKAEDVAKVAPDGTIDCWLTDPPYNVAYEGSNGLTIKNDSMEDKKFREFLKTAFAAAETAMKPGAAFYIFHADSEGYNFRGALHDVELTVRECLVWKKNALVLGRQDYQWIHEPCLYGWKDGGAHKWYGDRSQTTVMEFDKPKKNDVHPTMKPVAMLIYLLQNSTKRGDAVLDTFGGSGSTLIACEQTGRKCRMVELDPKYCDVIRRRWAEHVHGEGCDWQSLTPKTKG